MSTPVVRFGRVGPPGAERPVALVGEDAFDLAPVTADLTSRALEEPGIAAMVAAARSGALPRTAIDGERIGPPVADPRKIVCIGLNYHLHARETGAAVPTEPIVFLKDPACVVGPDDDVFIPVGSTKTDWEVELAVVIGRTARYLPDPAAAWSCIAGYTIANDVSEREFQLERGGQWDKGKCCETFNPLGPWLVAAESIPDPQALELRLWVNGLLRQSSTTGDMIFPVDHLVWYLSQFMVLRPGDVVNTGTPSGVALGLPDTPYLRAGDVMELEITGLGRQRQHVRTAPRS